jgi:hypothetical protein
MQEFFLLAFERFRSDFNRRMSIPAIGVVFAAVISYRGSRIVLAKA